MELDWSRHLPKHVWLQIAHHCSAFGGRTLAALQSVNSGLRALLLSRRNALWERSFGARFAHSRVVVVRGCSVDDSWDRWFVRVVQQEREEKIAQKLLYQEQIEMVQERLRKIPKRLQRVQQELKELRDVGDDDDDDCAGSRKRSRSADELQNVVDRLAETISEAEERLNELQSRLNELKAADLANLADGFSLKLSGATSAEDAEERWLCLQDAVNAAVEGDIVVVFPGIYEYPEPDQIDVYVPVHIVGCCFNRLYAANASTARHAADVIGPLGRDSSNIIVRSINSDAFAWFASGGSLRNMDVCFLGEVNQSAIVVGAGSRLNLLNVGITSTRNGYSAQDQTECNAFGCRFSSCKFGAVTFLEQAVGHLDDCIFDGNTSGVKINGGNVRITRSSFFGNRCNGVCVAGNSQIALENCSIFENNLHGVEVMRDVPPSAISIRGCHVSGNMHGLSISQSASASQKPEQLQHMLYQMNDVAGNRVSDVRVTLSLENESLIDIALQNRVCTFMYTGTNHYAQKQWCCNSCGMKDGFIICSVCAETCHKGHDVVFHGDEGKAYCDDVLECPGQCCFAQEFKEQVKK